jgi:GH24 family phage-related lysozyme (muramidase)
MKDPKTSQPRPLPGLTRRRQAERELFLRAAT